MIDVLCVSGTGEHASPGEVRPHGLLADVTKHLDPDRFISWAVRYPASYGPVGGTGVGGVDYERSVEEGLAMLLAEIRSTSNVVGVLGYSQGSTVVTRLLDGLGRGEFPDVEVAFAGLVANPHRAPGWVSIDGSNQGHGIAGSHERWPEGVRIWEVAQPKDPICSLSAGSPLRGLPELTASFSFSDPVRWGADLVNAARENKRHRAWLSPSWWDAGRAVDDALNYLVRGEHTCYGVRRMPGSAHTYCEELAHRINTEVWE